MEIKGRVGVLKGHSHPQSNPPDPKILLYGDPTPTQRAQIEKLIELGSVRLAAKHFGITKNAIQKARHAVEKRAVAAGFIPGVMDASRFSGSGGQKLNGLSVLTRTDDGESIWLKFQENKKNIEDILSTCLERYTEKLQAAPKIKAPVKTTETVTVYNITDYHVGAYAFGKETLTGNWDKKIAEEVFYSAIIEMIESSPSSEKAIFAQMGDFLHWDGIDAVTPTAKNLLDADGRFQELTDLSADMMIWAVESMLKKHDNVHIIPCEGNHDIASSAWLRTFLPRIFRNNPRVTVDNSPFPYYAYVFGEVLLAWHHGHLTKIKQLPGKFMSEFRELYGQTKITYIHTGHTHTMELFEDSGAIIERHPTLNARDSYGARGFQRTMRAAHAITYSRYGEKSRVTVYPEI